MSHMQGDLLPIINALQYAKSSTGSRKENHFSVADLQRCEGKECKESGGNFNARNFCKISIFNIIMLLSYYYIANLELPDYFRTYIK